MDRDFLAFASLFEGLIRQPWIAAHKLSGSIDDHLRCIHACQFEAGAVRILAVAEKAGRVRIRPADAVPVIHMLAENDELLSRDRLRPVKLLQEGIRRRTSGTSFGREQLN